MYYPDDIVEEVRTRSDIVEVISQYVRLTKKGGSYFGLCPFHSEKTPSFSVSPDRQMYYCFGCHRGGNVFSFIMDYENYTFTEALSSLADRAGVRLPYGGLSEREKQDRSIKKRLFDANREAATFYFNTLRSPIGAAGRRYLGGRAISEDVARKFGLGYSPKTDAALYNYLKNEGFEDDLLKETGLIRYSDRGARDYFFNRVMFPIMDANHRVVGFGGRVMGDGEPKYLNTPTTRLFDKARTLYGLNIAKSSRRDYFLLCEGYMDVISLHKAGFDCAVASLGTSFTEGHAALIRRYVTKAVISYDSDTAGRTAAKKAAGILRGAGVSVRVLDMRPHKDPDEFIKALGAEAFEERISQSVNALLFELDLEREKYSREDPAENAKFQQEVVNALVVFEDELERENYLEAAASRYGIRPQILRDMVARAGYAYPQTTRKDPDVGAVRQRRKTDGIAEAQRFILRQMAFDTANGRMAFEYFTPDDFMEGAYREVAQILTDAHNDGIRVSPSAILDKFVGDSEKSGIVAGIFSGTGRGADKDKTGSDADDRIFAESVKRLKRHAILEKMSGEGIDAPAVAQLKKDLACWERFASRNMDR